MRRRRLDSVSAMPSQSGGHKFNSSCEPSKVRENARHRRCLEVGRAANYRHGLDLVTVSYSLQAQSRPSCHDHRDEGSASKTVTTSSWTQRINCMEISVTTWNILPRTRQLFSLRHYQNTFVFPLVHVASGGICNRQSDGHCHSSGTGEWPVTKMNDRINSKTVREKKTFGEST